MRYLLMLALLLSLVTPIHAQARGKLAKKSVEFAARKFGSKPAPTVGKHAIKKTVVRRAAATTVEGNAVVLAKHATLAKPLITQYGETATQAFARLSNRNARRLAMLADDGLTPNKELLSVIARYGDPAMNFIWKNKGALLTASALTAFLANPELFINGVTDLSCDVAEHALEPVAKGVATGTQWTLVIPIVVALFLTGSLFRRSS